MIALFAALALNAAANLLMKLGMKQVAAGGGLFREGAFGAASTVLTSVPLIVGLTCFVLNAMFYMYALQSPALKISIAYPIMVGGGFALIALVARFHPAWDERLTVGQVAGVGMVLIGIMLIAGQPETRN
jgi:small multidrug resistance pump